ncbi:MAG: rhomboid family intramembrane serine protease [Actinobacteria bacterium]|nr:rhomboid family intramembrane serine protease [Actinomycetota bacterium]MCB9389021.1 rhomboid family intramembrane serine protease [Acidimicrobiia bacterium]
MNCARHPDRPTGVTCQRCGKPICADCMVSAPVGYHCQDCQRRGGQKIRTVRSLYNQPVATRALVVANVVAFIAAQVFNLDPDGWLTVRQVADGEWWRLITSAFLHAGLLHLAFNMWALFLWGEAIEARLGTARFLGLYAVSLASGSLGVVALTNPGTPTVGASGAIFGLMGVLIAVQRYHNIDIWRSGLGGVMVLNLVFTFVGANISIGGHLGGFLGGLIAGGLLMVNKSDSRTQTAALVLSTILLLGLAVIVAQSRWG